MLSGKLLYGRQFRERMAVPSKRVDRSILSFSHCLRRDSNLEVLAVHSHGGAVLASPLSLRRPGRQAAPSLAPRTDLGESEIRTAGFVGPLARRGFESPSSDNPIPSNPSRLRGAARSGFIGDRPPAGVFASSITRTLERGRSEISPRLLGPLVESAPWGS